MDTQIDAASTADPDGLPVSGPLFVDDSLRLFSQPNVKPWPWCASLRSSTLWLNILAGKLIRLPVSLGKRNASSTPVRSIVYREQRDLPNGTNGFIVVAFAVTIVIILG